MREWSQKELSETHGTGMREWSQREFSETHGMEEVGAKGQCRGKSARWVVSPLAKNFLILRASIVQIRAQGVQSEPTCTVYLF